MIHSCIKLVSMFFFYLLDKKIHLDAFLAFIIGGRPYHPYSLL